MAAVALDGNDSIPDTEISDSLATRETPKFLGLVRGLVYEYETYNPHVLQRDMERVARIYHGRGFHQVSIQTGRVLIRDGHVYITLVVREGPRTTVSAVLINGLETLPAELRRRARESYSDALTVGDSYDEQALDDAKQALERVLKTSGYAYVQSSFKVLVDLPRAGARVFVTIATGPRVTLGTITFEGHGAMPEGVLRGMIPLRKGQAYDLGDFEEAEQELMNLGVFSSVTVQLDPEDDFKRAQSPGPATLPVVVKTQPSKVRSLALGGGIEADIIKAGVHVSSTWRNQNLLGGLRDLTVSLVPGVALYPTRVPDFPPPDRYLPQVKSQISLTQPAFLEPKTKGTISVKYDIYPVLLSTDAPEDAPIVGYRELRGRASLERRFGAITLTPSYNLQAGVPFTYTGQLAQNSKGVYLSYLELVGALDLRNDRVKPTTGLLASVSLQAAGLGGSARDIRVEPELRGYLPVVRDKSGFAARVKFGWLAPFNYGTPGSPGNLSVEDTQIAYFRSFFSGGPASNRGYPYRGVGPHGAVEFFYPTYEQATSGLDCNDPQSTDRACSIPLGGRSIWETSLEFRFRLSEALSGTVFCDASDVYGAGPLLVLGRPHLSCGFGPRYDTPVGPIRLDIGYRIAGLQVLVADTRNEGEPRALLGLPINVSFGIGEAF